MPFLFSLCLFWTVFRFDWPLFIFRCNFALLCTSIKFGFLDGFLVVVLLVDELADFCDSTILNFVFIMNTFKQVFAERRIQKGVIVLGVQHTSHELQADLLNIIALRTKSNDSWQIHWHRLHAIIVLVHHFLFSITHALSNSRRS